MSSDFFTFEEPFHQHSSLFNSEETQLLTESDPFSVLSDSSIDSLLQEFSEEPSTITELQNSSNLDQFESLSLYQQTHFSNLPISSDFSGGYLNCPVSAIKTEDSSMSLSLNSEDCFLGGDESSMMRLHLERGLCHGSRSYEEEKPWMIFQPRLFDALFQSSVFDNGFSNNGQMRRVCSTGDLPKVLTSNQASGQGESYGNTSMEEANFKVGKYSAEERKEKIDRYRAKRNQRNFTKKIKYACRKTLADNRPRVRGRFARNEVDVGEMPKPTTSCLNAHEEEDDSLLYSWPEEEGVRNARSRDCGAGGCGGDDKIRGFTDFAREAHLSATMPGLHEWLHY